MCIVCQTVSLGAAALTGISGARLTNLHGLVLYSDSDSDTKGGRAVTNGYYSFVPQIYIAP